VHQQALKHAYEEADIRAVPTFIIGDEVIQGLASKERLAQVIEKEEAKNKRNEFDGLKCDGKVNC
jgi:predicted DsbA family dithiol-disulfide isomerase